jgi:hypothetical protein
VALSLLIKQESATHTTQPAKNQSQKRSYLARGTHQIDQMEMLRTGFTALGLNPDLDKRPLQPHLRVGFDLCWRSR